METIDNKNSNDKQMFQTIYNEVIRIIFKNRFYNLFSAFLIVVFIAGLVLTICRGVYADKLEHQIIATFAIVIEFLVFLRIMTFIEKLLSMHNENVKGWNCKIRDYYGNILEFMYNQYKNDHNKTNDNINKLQQLEKDVKDLQSKYNEKEREKELLEEKSQLLNDKKQLEIDIKKINSEITRIQ